MKDEHMLVHRETIDSLEALVYNDRRAMGEAVADEVILAIEELLEEKDTINMLFAAAPSQAELLEGLRSSKRIPWERINAFHMDEYIGLDPDAPQRFGNFLDRALFASVPLRKVPTRCTQSWGRWTRKQQSGYIPTM